MKLPLLVSFGRFQVCPGAGNNLSPLSLARPVAVEVSAHSPSAHTLQDIALQLITEKGAMGASLTPLWPHGLDEVMLK